MKILIDSFFALVGEGKIEIYNEFSIQHEFGIFLRERMPGRKVQFERNVAHFGLNKSDFVKSEIDICVFTESSRDYAIELKYPRNGQYPETMYGFCKDIRFLEQLVASGFDAAHFIAVSDDKLFYSGNFDSMKKVYGLFRGAQPITGEIAKPTGNKGGASTSMVVITPVGGKLRGHQNTVQYQFEYGRARHPHRHVRRLLSGRAHPTRHAGR